MKELLKKIVVWKCPGGSTRRTIFIADALKIKVLHPKGKTWVMTIEAFKRLNKSFQSKCGTEPFESEDEFIQKEVERLKTTDPVLAASEYTVEEYSG